RLSGIVTASPRQPSLTVPRKSANSPAPTSIASNRQSRPSTSYAAACSTGDLECAMGEPSTASRIPVWALADSVTVRALRCATPLLKLSNGRVVLSERLRELGLPRLEVDRHEEEPRTID